MDDLPEVIGYRDGNKNSPVYGPIAGYIATRAFIFCNQCRYPISTNGGPQSDTWCTDCTSKKDL